MTEPTQWDYLKAAFFARRRVKGLGGMPLNVLFVLGAGVAGLLNPGIWLIGAGVELAYLTWLSHDERFRALVRGEHLRRQALTADQQLEALVASLSPESQVRWKRLQQRCRQIRETSASLAPGLGAGDDPVKSGLDSLLLIHGRLLASREALETALDAETRYELERKIDDATGRLAEATSDAAKRSIESSLEILRKRREHARSADENLQVVDAELDRIENQADLIREELLVNRDPTALSARIDAVTSMMGEANRFLRDNEALLGPLGAAADPTAMPGLPPRTRTPA
jgi:hypothetical protein